MDYSQLSDFEINRMVGDIIFKGLWACKPETSGNNTNKWYYGNADTTFEPLTPLPDYCNDPSASWPIITENKISIMFDSTDTRYEGEYHEWCDAISSCQKFGIQYQSNPLRAAMIVFLMMQDANNA